MSIEISREIAIQLAEEARRQGVSVDVLLERFINEHTLPSDHAQSGPELPVWHLGDVGALHRRDIYEDAR